MPSMLVCGEFELPLAGLAGLPPPWRHLCLSPRLAGCPCTGSGTGSSAIRCSVVQPCWWGIRCRLVCPGDVGLVVRPSLAASPFLSAEGLPACPLRLNRDALHQPHVERLPSSRDRLHGGGNARADHGEPASLAPAERPDPVMANLPARSPRRRMAGSGCADRTGTMSIQKS